MIHKGISQYIVVPSQLGEGQFLPFRYSTLGLVHGVVMLIKMLCFIMRRLYAGLYKRKFQEKS